jgi:hypothetical protein
MFTSHKSISLPPFPLDPLCCCSHQADIKRLLIGQPYYMFLTHSRNSSGKCIYKKGDALSLNTTANCSMKCQWTDYIFQQIFRWFKENVAFDLPKKHPPIELPDFAQGQVCQSFQLLSFCTDRSECSVLDYICDECQVSDMNACSRLLYALFISEIIWSGKGLSHGFSYHVSQIKIYCIIYKPTYAQLIWTDITLQFFVYSHMFQCNSANFRQSVDQYLKLTRL